MTDIKGKFPNGLAVAMSRKGLGPTELVRLVGGETSKQNLVRYLDQERKLPPELAERLAPILGTTRDELIFGDGAAQPAGSGLRVAPRKFIRNKSFKFYVKDWRAFMGVKVEDAAETAGMPADEYGAREEYPINFDLGQIVALAEEFGIRPEQFFFPPPKDKPRPAAKAAPAAKKVRSR